MKKYIIIFALFSYIGSYGQSIITDRPDQTESSSTIPKGNIQIESGILFGTNEDEFFSEEILLAPTILWRYGISNKIELRLLTEFISLKDEIISKKESGLTDLQLGAKFQLLKKQSAKTEIAFLSHIIVPTAKRALTLDEIGTINKLSIAHDIGDNFGLGYNIGYDYFGVGSGNFTYSLAFGLTISDKVNFYLEPYGVLVDFDRHESNFDAGLTYLVNNKLQLDMSAGLGVNHKMNYVSIGCSFIIGIQKEN